MNNKRMDAWKEVNKPRTYTPVKITGIEEIKGKNMTIETTAELTEIEAPDIQYDTSDAEVAQTALGVAGLAVGAKILSDSQKVQVVEQPAPVIVEQPAPIIVQ